MKHKWMLRFLSVFTLLAMLPACFAGYTVMAENEPKDVAFESRKTPIMGWASWNAYRTDISEAIIRILKENGCEVEEKRRGRKPKAEETTENND